MGLHGEYEGVGALGTVTGVVRGGVGEIPQSKHHMYYNVDFLNIRFTRGQSNANAVSPPRYGMKETNGQTVKFY